MEFESNWTREEIEKLLNLQFDGDKIHCSPQSADTDFVGNNGTLFSNEDLELFYQRLHSGKGREIDNSVDNDCKKRAQEDVKEFFYPISRQRRPGTHHGKGGRRVLGSAKLRREAIPANVCRLISRTFVIDGDVASFFLALETVFLRSSVSLGESTNPDSREKLNTIMEEMHGEASYHGTFLQFIPDCPYVAICFKFPYSQVAIREAEVMDRHSVCSWLGKDGKLHCTCIGSTKYRIRQQISHLEYEKSENFCIHLQGFHYFIRNISLCYQISWKKCAIALAEIRAESSPVSISEFNLRCPKQRRMHNGKVAVISEMIVGRDCPEIQFTPVRVVMKGGEHFVCAFCDTSYGGSCHHAKSVKNIPEERAADEVESPRVERTANGMDGAYMPFPEDNFEVKTERNHVSHLPLSPMNCAKALEIDFAVVRAARERKPYLLEAPSICIACGSARNEESGKTWKDGIIMCTVGPCILHVEEYMCSNEALCGMKIHAEGRQECVLIDKMTSVATHALLRRELLGVVLSNGTLTGRLKHFHSQVTSHMQCGCLPSYPFPRSVRTLQRLATIMLTLMVMSPDPKLFECEKCEYSRGQRIKQIPAICVDGIYQGYVKSKQVTTENISQECKPMPYSNSASNGSTRRPLTRLIRREQTISILLKAIRGLDITCSQENVKDLAMSIRLVSKDTLPPQFCSESICGRTPNDYLNDLGETSAVTALRNFTNSIFNSQTLLYRLLKPLEDFYRDCVSKGKNGLLQKIGAFSRETRIKLLPKMRRFPSLSENLKSTFSVLFKNDSEALWRRGVCWRSVLHGVFGGEKQEKEMRKEFQDEIMNLYKMVLQGPVTQFVRKSDTDSLRNLASKCCDPDLDVLLEVYENRKS